MKKLTRAEYRRKFAAKSKGRKPKRAKQAGVIVIPEGGAAYGRCFKRKWPNKKEAGTEPAASKETETTDGSSQ
ncbi:MAG: hypothetical protein HQ581_01175 [Planctomycetes bacterium]|nr:hypothetical protein [Planctomycetota bacterium]